ncbi:UNVERIFIED_CONTAM: hypothetical protein GTU68_041036 [Idotea baltica]|nr:hypothetical protein [Idotea baltica]
MTDPIADMLTRIRNAVSVERPQVDMPLSKVKSGVADVLKREGYICLEVTCPDQTHIDVKGCCKQTVGQFAAEVRALRKPEPYKGKGIRYVGEQIDDEAGRTIAAASTRDKDLAGKISYGGNCEAAKMVGTAIAEKAKAAGVTEIKFDRGPYKFHGRVAELANAAREAGLKF